MGTAHKITMTELIDQVRKWDMVVVHKAMLAVSFSYLEDIICVRIIYAVEESVLCSVTEG